MLTVHNYKISKFASVANRVVQQCQLITLKWKKSTSKSVHILWRIH